MACMRARAGGEEEGAGSAGGCGGASYIRDRLPEGLPAAASPPLGRDHGTPPAVRTGGVCW